MKWRLFGCILVLVVGVFLPLSPASTWVSSTEEGATGAPVVAVGPDGLVDARRAAGDANTQAGFLAQGTAELVEGVQGLDGGVAQLMEALNAAEAGAQQLSSGMVQLQAGTGQLANGSTQVADAVGEVVDQVAGFEAVRGQVVAAIDRTLESLAGAKEPEVVAAREQLRGLREQAVAAQLPAELTQKMFQLRDGSREVANQLSVPGYAYRDGVFTATNGAAQLAQGLSEMKRQVAPATDGLTQLRDGAAQLDHMAQLNKEKVAAVRAALPVAPRAATAGDAGQEEAAPGSSFAPIAAMLVAALVAVGALAVGAAAFFSTSRSRLIYLTGSVFVAVTGGLLAFLVAHDLQAVHVVGMAGVLLAGALGLAGLVLVLGRTVGAGWAVPIAALFTLVQVGVVGWLWRSAASAPVAGVWERVAGALPAHWVTSALSALGNQGQPATLWTSVALCIVFALFGLLGGLWYSEEAHSR